MTVHSCTLLVYPVLTHMYLVIVLKHKNMMGVEIRYATHYQRTQGTQMPRTRQHIVLRRWRTS